MFRVGCLSWGAEPIKEAGERLPDFMGVARQPRFALGQPTEREQKEQRFVGSALTIVAPHANGGDVAEELLGIHRAPVCVPVTARVSSA